MTRDDWKSYERIAAQKTASPDRGAIIVAQSMLEAPPGAISAAAYRGAIEGLLRYIEGQSSVAPECRHPHCGCRVGKCEHLY